MKNESLSRVDARSRAAVEKSRTGLVDYEAIKRAWERIGASSKRRKEQT
jgi:hypothetical protein